MSHGSVRTANRDRQVRRLERAWREQGHPELLRDRPDTVIEGNCLHGRLRLDLERPPFTLQPGNHRRRVRWMRNDEAESDQVSYSELRGISDQGCSDAERLATLRGCRGHGCCTKHQGEGIGKPPPGTRTATSLAESEEQSPTCNPLPHRPSLCRLVLKNAPTSAT